MNKITWSVTKVINGHGDGIVDGDRTVVASGEVEKEGDPIVLRRELTAALESAYPKLSYGSTYNIDHIYDIAIEENGDSQT